jgi:predicted transcriptional regulator
MVEDNSATETVNDLMALTADIVSAHVSNNSVAASDVAGLIQSVYSALQSTATPAAAQEEKRDPAVPVRSSVKPDYIVCLEDGAKVKMLKRYLATRYNLTPDEYRRKWGLQHDYPMVCPNYSEQRKELAKTIGLGRKKGDTVASKAAPPKAKAVKSAPEALKAAKARVSKPKADAAPE